MAPSELPTTIGRYIVLQKIGEGGIGILYKARDPVMERLVAIKQFKLDLESRGKDFVAKLSRWEAFISGKLIHPNIVTVYDVGVNGNQPYIVMEFIEGKDLWRMAREHGPLEIEYIVEVLSQVSDALDVAHRQGIVHLDMKPNNVLVTEEGRVKIVDFGMARFLPDISLPISRPLEKGGTPAYLAPEQIQDEQYDARSDIFALGVVLYELLTGKNPFAAPGFAKAVYNIVHLDPPPPSTMRSAIHPGLDFVVKKALSKDPAKRYQSVREFAYDLRNYTFLSESPDKLRRRSNDDLATLLQAKRDSGRKGNEFSLLVFDQDPHTVSFFNGIFGAEGFQVSFTGSPEEGVELTRQYPPDLILVDGSSATPRAYEFCRILRKDALTADTPILFLLGQDRPFVRFQSYRPGVDDYVIKPFNVQEILARMKAALIRTGRIVPAVPESPRSTESRMNEIHEAITGQDWPRALKLCVEDLNSEGKNYQALKYLETLRRQFANLAQAGQLDRSAFDRKDLFKIALDFYNFNSWNEALELFEILAFLAPDNERVTRYIEIVTRHLDEDYQKLLHPLTRKPQIASADPAAYKTSLFSSEEGYWLSRIDGQTSFQALIQMAGSEKRAAQRVLCNLLEKGLIKVAPEEPRPARITGPHRR